MGINILNKEFFILQRMIEGDEKALKYFFDSYYVDLCNFVNSYIKNEIISEDIVQSIFIYFWEKKKHFHLIILSRPTYIQHQKTKVLTI